MRPRTPPPALNFTPSPARCADLKAKGLLTAATLPDQATEAQAIINDYGILPEQNLVQPGYSFANVAQSISVTYANTYGRFSVLDNLCSYSFAAAAFQAGRRSRSRPKRGEDLRHQQRHSADLRLALINNAAPGGPKEERGSTPEPESRRRALPALARHGQGRGDRRGAYRHAARQARRIAEGVEDIRATGKLRRVPAVFVTGRNDGILPPNFTSRAYFGLNNVVDGSTSSLRYYEVTNAQHLDSFNPFPGYNDKYIPLHRYFISGDGSDVRPPAAGRAVAAEPGGAHGAARSRRAADHRGQRAADCRLAARECADHLQRGAGSDTGLRARSAGYIPQFHIGPIGVCVQHGPKLPAFQRPR